MGARAQLLGVCLEEGGAGGVADVGATKAVHVRARGAEVDEDPPQGIWRLHPQDYDLDRPWGQERIFLVLFLLFLVLAYHLIRQQAFPAAW